MHRDPKTKAANPGPRSHRLQTKSPRRRLLFLPPSALTPDPNNPRNHPIAQVRAIGRSIETFGFNAPILADNNGWIIACHGPHEAALLLDLSEVPVIFLDDLTASEAKAYMLADN